MRNFIIMVVLMLGVSTTMFAQQMFKVEAASQTTTDDWIDAEDVEITSKILIKYTDEIITVYWEEVTRSWYVRTSEVLDNADLEITEGEDKQHMVFSCVDSEGVECNIMVSWFKDKEYAFDGLYDYSFKFIYSDLWWAFYSNELK